jgi:Wall-associated receptor kinase galacturonan-binding
MPNNFAKELMLLLVLLLQLLQINSAAAGAVGLPGCPTTCGNITIPYPFGTGTGCYFGEGFNLTCDDTAQHPKLFFGYGDGTIEVIEISLSESILRLKSTPLTSLPSEEKEVVIGLPDEGTFSLVVNQSVLITLGCNIISNILVEKKPVAACTPLCSVNYTGHTCSGIICSQASAAVYIYSTFTVKISPLTLNGSNKLYDAKQNTALLVEQAWLINHELELIKFLDPFSDHQESQSMIVPFVIEWSIIHHGFKRCLEAKENISDYQCHSDHHICSDTPYNGYRCQCHCQPGYEGNAYLANGCEGKFNFLNITVKYLNNNYHKKNQHNSKIFE